MASILVVEDELDIQELIRYNLDREGYTVYTAPDGESGLRLALQQKPDLIILDIMLPGINGLDVCKQLRRDPHTENTPIIMVTAKGEDSDVVTGLELGANDYVTKPFSPRVLVARIRAALRTTQIKQNDTQSPGILTHMDIEMDEKRHRVRVQGNDIELSATEYGILNFLLKSPGWVFSRNQIIDAVKGKDYPVTERAVDVQILGLRKKLGVSGDLIQTVRGVGYKLASE